MLLLSTIRQKLDKARDNYTCRMLEESEKDNVGKFYALITSKKKDQMPVTSPLSKRTTMCSPIFIFFIFIVIELARPPSGVKGQASVPVH